MKLGITSVYLSKYGLIDGAKRMKRHGYDCVDYQNFTDTGTDFFNLSEKDFEKKIKYERDVIESEGLCVYQAHGPWRYPPRDLELGDRAERFEAMSKAIRGSAYLGAKTMVIHPLMPFGANVPDRPDEVYKINFDFFGALCEVAKEYGIVISYENMPFIFHPIHSVKEFTDFAKKINSDNFKVCLDTGHCIRCGEDLADAVRYIGRDMLFAMHVHDNDGLHDRHWIPKTGVGDWNSFSDVLSEIGVDGVFSFETSVKGEYTEQEQERLEIELAKMGKQLARIRPHLKLQNADFS